MLFIFSRVKAMPVIGVTVVHSDELVKRYGGGAGYADIGFVGGAIEISLPPLPEALIRVTWCKNKSIEV